MMLDFDIDEFVRETTPGETSTHADDSTKKTEDKAVKLGKRKMTFETTSKIKRRRSVM